MKIREPIFQVADIEEKLDILIKAYMQDRERLLALPLVPENSSHSTNYKNNPPAPPPPPAPGAGILTSSTSVVSALFLPSPPPPHPNAIDNTNRNTLKICKLNEQFGEEKCKELKVKRLLCCDQN